MSDRRLLSLVLLLTAVLAGSASAAWGSAPQWNIERVGAPVPAPSVVIAVVDTGVDANHPALAGRVLDQIDFVDDGKTGDPHGHGTHVAGTAAGADNSCGNIGVAPDAGILPVRVLDEEGAGSLGDVIDGIRAAADAGAMVINLSLSSDVVIRPVVNGDLRAAFDYAWSKGSIPVLASGNDALLGSLLGSGYSDLKAIVVTATDPDDRKPAYATRIGSAEWGIAAPGGDDAETPGRGIVSAFPDNRCASMIGTSMAAPHVSGGAAALRAAGYGQRQTVDRLLATARELGDSGTFGAGLLDLRAALSAPSTTSAPATTQPATTSAPQTTAPSSSPTTVAGTAPPSSPPSSGTDRTAASSSTSTTGASDLSEVPPDTSPGGPESSTESAESPGGATIVEDDEGGPPTTLVALAAALLVAAGAGVWFTLRTR